jgi:plasmid stabilization system protein ParE
MRVNLHPEALAEFQLAAAFYESERPGLALRFVEAVDATIARIVESPNVGRPIDENVRRCLTRVFPYGVLYASDAESVHILAVAHLAREPGYWKARL